MGRTISLLGLVVVAALGGFIYMKQIHEITPEGVTTKASVNVIGVRNDLLSMANAEKRYRVFNSKYASLDELRTNGDITVPSRPDFRYAADAGDSTFTISATYVGADPRAPRRISIDENLELSSN